MVLLHLLKSNSHLEESLPEYIPLHLEFVARQFQDFGENVASFSSFHAHSIEESSEIRLISFMKHRIIILNEWLGKGVEKDTFNRKRCILALQSLIKEKDSMLLCVSSSSSASFSSSLTFHFAFLNVIHMRLKV